MDPRYQSPNSPVVDVDTEDEFRDLSRHTTVLVWLLRAGAVVYLLSLVSSWLQLEMLSRDFTSAEGAANDRREAMIGGLSSLLILVTLVTFGRWIVLAHRNLPALGAQRLEVRPGWAVGWFFIPVLNLWKPYQAMRSLWRSSRDVHRPDLQESTWILPTWWTAWLISSTLGNTSFRMQLRANSVDDYTLLTKIALVECLAGVALYVVASLLVSRIWRAQAQQHDHPVEPPKGFADAA